MNKLTRWSISFFIIFSMLFGLAQVQFAGAAQPASLGGGGLSGWTFQRVDDRHVFSYNGFEQSSPARHNLKFDSLGMPHIVYGGDHLYHTWYSNTFHTWFNQVIDPADNVGGFASLAIDSQDRLHIAYYDATNQDLKYATNRDGSWMTVTIQSSGNVGRGTDIAVDQWRDPHIVYFNASEAKLYYTYSDPGQGTGYWEPPELVSGSRTATSRFAMAFRNPLEVHVIFWQITGNTTFVGTLYYSTTKTTTRWQPLSAFSGNENCGRELDIALDSSGYPHIVFSYGDEVGNDVSRYYKSINNGTSWTAPHGDGGIVELGVPTGLALRLDGSNNPQIALQYAGVLYNYYWNGAAWASRTVDTGSTGYFPAIALTSSGTIGFAYLTNPDGTGIYLKYRSWNGTFSSVSQIDRSEEVGRCSTILTGSDGYPWIIYSGDTAKTLYFKHFYNGAWQTAQEIYPSVTGKVNCAHAAAVSGGKAGVLFYTNENNLYFSEITCSGAACVISPAALIATPVTRPFFALDYDSASNPYVLHLNETPNPDEMVLKSWNGSGWNSTTNPTSPGGSFSDHPVSMKRTPGGAFHIIYEKVAGWDELYYVSYARGSWTDPLLLNSDEVSDGVSLDTTATGSPVIAFTTSKDPSKILLNQRPVSAWEIAFEADSYPWVSSFYYPSLVVDSMNRQHLSYVLTADDGINYLKYTTRAGSHLSKFTLSFGSNLPKWSSLTLSPRGRAWISYGSPLGGDLMFARQWDQVFMPVVTK